MQPLPNYGLTVESELSRSSLNRHFKLIVPNWIESFSASNWITV